MRFATSQGNIDVVLLPESAPLTVQNFLNYMNRGDYNNSIFHRSVRGFIIQGGGFRWVDSRIVEIPADPPVRNEYAISNTRGTIAMAKLGDNPNSATNQWFFNLANNASNLNNQNGGFTVFGRVAPNDNASLTVMDRIANVPVYDSVPLLNYVSGREITQANTILVRSISILGPTPAITSGGVITASAFGGAAQAASGSFLEIYGSNLAGDSRTWANGDFVNGVAPTALNDVSVTIGGRPAFVYYVSPTQVNVQTPDNLPTGQSLPVVVTYRGQASPQAMVSIRPTAGGLLAPANFNAGGKQYAVAMHADGRYVSNGSIEGLPSAPAAPGETLVFYGTGFGSVVPATVPGQIASGASSLAIPVQFQFGESAGQVIYAGLVPELVGLYQFNVTVPANAPDGDLRLTFKQGEETTSQTLYVPVKR